MLWSSVLIQFPLGLILFLVKPTNSNKNKNPSEQLNRLPTHMPASQPGRQKGPRIYLSSSRARLG